MDEGVIGEPIEAYIERLIPLEPHQGFEQRHPDFAIGIRQRILGSIATQSEMGEDSPTILRDRIEQIYNKHLDELVLYAGVKSLDNYLYNHEWQYEGERKEAVQEEVLNDVLSALAGGHREGHIGSATSTGKTYILAKLAEAFSQNGMRVLIVSPTKTISEQIVGHDQAKKKGLAAFAPNIDIGKVGRHFGSRRASKEDQVVVSTYQSLNNFSESGELGEFDVILADEAHRSLGDVTSKSIKQFSPHAIKIGVTATTDFGANKSVDQLFPYKIHNTSLKEAIEADRVAPIQCLVFETNEEIKIHDPYYAEFTPQELRRLINLKSRNQKAVQFAHDFVQAGRQGIVSCVPGADMAHTKLLAEELSQQTVTNPNTGETRNIKAKAVGGFLEDGELKQALADYEAGKIDVLTFVGVLGEGWDSDAASFIINTCPTTSIVKLTQQIGRVVRKKSDGNHAIVVDFVDEVIGKKQVTALHVLDEEEISLDKMYGPSSSQPIGDEAHNYLRGILNPELYKRLQAVDGSLLADLYIPPNSKRTRAQAYYDRLLEKEGLYADTNIMGVPQKIYDGIVACEEFYLEERQRLPDREELMKYLIDDKVLPPTKADEMLDGAVLAQHVAYEDMDELLSNESYLAEESLHEEVNQRLAKAEVKKHLEELGERDKDLIRLRFGLDGHEARSFRELGDFFNISGARVAQVEARALSQLRNPTDSELHSYYVETEKTPSRPKTIAAFLKSPLGQQASVFNLLSNPTRSYVLSKYAPILPPVLVQHGISTLGDPRRLERIVHPASQKAHERLFTEINQLVSSLQGDLSSYTEKFDEYPARMLKQSFGSVRPELYYRDLPEDFKLEDLGTPPVNREHVINLLDALRFSRDITKDVIDLNKLIRPARHETEKSLAQVYFHNGMYDAIKLSKRWQVPQKKIVEAIIARRAWEYTQGRADYTLIRGGSAPAVLNELKKMYRH